MTSRQPFPPRIIYHNPDPKPSKAIQDQFMMLVSQGNPDALRTFLNETGYVPQREIDGRIPVSVALTLDDSVADDYTKLQLIKILHRNGASLDAPDQNNKRPIHYAANLQDKAIVEYLIKNGVDLNGKDSSGNTALHQSIYGKKVPCHVMELPEDLMDKKEKAIVLNKRVRDDTKKVIAEFEKPGTNTSIYTKALTDTLLNLDELLLYTSLQKEASQIVEKFNEFNPDLYASPEQIKGQKTNLLENSIQSLMIKVKKRILGDSLNAENISI